MPKSIHALDRRIAIAGLYDSRLQMGVCTAEHLATKVGGSSRKAGQRPSMAVSAHGRWRSTPRKGVKMPIRHENREQLSQTSPPADREDMEETGWDQKVELWQSLRYCAWNDRPSRPEVYFRWSFPTLEEGDREEREEYYCATHADAVKASHEQETDQVAQEWPDEMHIMAQLLDVEFMTDSDRVLRADLEAELWPGGLPDRR